MGGTCRTGSECPRGLPDTQTPVLVHLSAFYPEFDQFWGYIRVVGFEVWSVCVNLETFPR